MAKYIIDIPEKAMMYLNVWEYEDGKCVWTDSYLASDLRPYTASESYIEGLSKGQKEVWGFLKALYVLSDEEMYEIFPNGCAYEMTYSEAKAKYEAWKRKREEISVGDEVKITEGGSLCVVCGIVSGTANLIFEDGGLGQFPVDKLIRTGLHFDEIEELLKKMGEVGKWVN